MESLSSGFSRFLKWSLRILIFPIVIYTAYLLRNEAGAFFSGNALKEILVNLIFIVLCALSFLFVYKTLNKYNEKKIVYFILLEALALRVLWTLLIYTSPTSDFAWIYNAGTLFSHGDYSAFKGTGYIARFSHLTIFAVYEGIVQMIFKNPIHVLKAINVIFSAASVYLIYMISKLIYNDKRAVYAAEIAALFPAFIMYTSVLCSENIAIPFFLLSIYFFICGIKRARKTLYFMLSGIFLVFGNFFRMVGYVFMAAYVMYFIIYCFKKNMHKISLKNIAVVILSFYIPLYIANALLMNFGITEYPLWKGREPFWTSVLKGTNVQSMGSWNKEDNDVAINNNFDYDLVSKEALSKIRSRFSAPVPDLMKFYIHKLVNEWSDGSFGSFMWSISRIKVKNNIVKSAEFLKFDVQFYYFVVLLFAYLSFYKDRNDDESINLFYIVFCGFGLLYLITEMQTRYAIVAAWIFIVLSVKRVNFKVQE